MAKRDGTGIALKWRKRTDGTKVAYWVCSTNRDFARFKPRTVRLWSGIEPTESDLLSIKQQCERLHSEMLDWRWSPQRKKPSAESKGKIYFIKGRDLVKVGYTAGDPIKRLNRLQTGSADPLVLLGFINGTPVTERQLHWRFKDWNAHGEWFHIKGAVSRFLLENFPAENTLGATDIQKGTSVGTRGTPNNFESRETLA